MLKSRLNWSGRTVGGITLGEPATADDGMYCWDGGVPDGEITADGTIVTSVVGDLVAPELAPEVPPVSKAEKDDGVVTIEVSVETREIVLKDKKGKKVDRVPKEDRVKVRDDVAVGDVPEV